MFRKGNRCADALARLGSSMVEDFFVFDNPPSPDVLYFVNTDATVVLYNRTSYSVLTDVVLYNRTSKSVLTDIVG